MPLLSRRRTTRADVPTVPEETEPPQLRTPRSAAWWILPITLLVGGVVGGLTWLLLAAGWSAAEATIRQDAIRTALAAGAAVGAAVTLMLAFRRQRHQEHNAHVTAHLAARNAAVAERNTALSELVADNNKHDATERRVTDLYTKAVEQLGHGKAAVRLGGLYALERVAQDNPGHRQTIVNVICAYLRMEYSVPAPADPAQERAAALRAARLRHHAARTGKTPPVAPHTTSADDASANRDGELQVRLTAQRILADHLRDNRPPDQRTTTPAQTLWEDMRIDLSGATLINPDFTDWHTADATFTNATFSGKVKFNRATFSGGAWFDKATFSGVAEFDEAAFFKDAWFDKATFVEDARFDKATFVEDAWFNKVTFSWTVQFDQATFSGNARFGQTVFSEGASFNWATFSRAVWFGWSTFSQDVQFYQATFPRVASFNQANFFWNAEFDDLTLTPTTWDENAFFRSPNFYQATAISGANHVWPDGWRLQEISATEGRLVEDSVANDTDKLRKNWLSRVGTLDLHLEEAGSAWKVDGENAGLERRVDETVAEAAHTTIAAAPPDASAHLEAAWSAAYGFHPDSEKAYSQAIKAAEAVVIPATIPNAGTPTLGTALKHMEDTAARWTVVLNDKTGNPASAEPVIGLIRMLWQGQRDRHAGGPTSKPTTQEAAEAAVHAAILIVQWFNSRAVVKNP